MLLFSKESINLLKKTDSKCFYNVIKHFYFKAFELYQRIIKKSVCTQILSSKQNKDILQRNTKQLNDYYREILNN